MTDTAYYFCLFFLLVAGTSCLIFPRWTKMKLSEAKLGVFVAVGIWLIISALLIIKQHNWISGLLKILETFRNKQ